MRITVGEDLPQAAVKMLRDQGYDAANVFEQGMDGLKDPYSSIQEEINWKALGLARSTHPTKLGG